MKILAIVQARLTSTRLPGKVLMKVGGKSLIARVCEAARDSVWIDKVVVAWAHKFPHLDENDVLGRFREIIKKHDPDLVVRLTSDCPLLTANHINETVIQFFIRRYDGYHANHLDGYDVQVFKAPLIFGEHFTDKEHVINDFETKPTGLSVNTLEDLERVRALVNEK